MQKNFEVGNMLDVFEIYEKMEKNDILLSFKGEITSDLLTSILQIMENKMVNMQEEPKLKKKVYNVLVECLQNLYHHMDDVSETERKFNSSAIFMIAKTEGKYLIYTGNYILNENIIKLKSILDEVNSLSKDELKEFLSEKLGRQIKSTVSNVSLL